MVQDPKDPFCCKTPECHPPPSYLNTTGTYTLPTPPVAIIRGGSATPIPTAPGSTQIPTFGTTIKPYPGMPTEAPSTQAPTLPPSKSFSYSTNSLSSCLKIIGMVKGYSKQSRYNMLN